MRDFDILNGDLDFEKFQMVKNILNVWEGIVARLSKKNNIIKQYYLRK